MIKCLAIDDEPLALQLLEDNIQKIPFLQLEAACDNAFAALEILNQQEIDLIFIDIQMPGLTGLQFVKSLKQKPMIIFVTAYKQYALEGYDLDVVDYLMKPVELSRFAAACNKAQELFQLRNNRKALNQLNYFFVNADYGQRKIVFDQIEWIEGLKDYVKIFLSENIEKPLVVRMSFKTLQDQLPSQKFMRIHKSFIVNLDKITMIKRSSIFINEMEFPVGDAFKNDLQNWISSNKT